jgi:hypothetical protein
MMSNVISRRLLAAEFIYPPPVEFSARFKPRTPHFTSIPISIVRRRRKQNECVAFSLT